METKWEAAAKNTEAALNELKTKLNLSDIPKRIECYDISHTSGTETVGSMVVAKNGKAANDQYRHFTIRTLKEGEVDDYKALAEVLKRRLRYLSANLKEEEAKWKKKGITFGKARKPEQKVLEEIHEQNKEHLSFKNIDYKEYVVARKDKKIIGFVRMSMRDDDKVLHMKSLWVNEKFRHYKLGQTITRFLLKQAKKEKVYIITSPSLEEYYADVGFRHVIKPPKGLGELDKRLSKETKQLTGLIMVYIPSEHKEDKSLNSKPDLIVIDGGKGQVSTVVKVLKEMNLEIPVIGLAKKEEEVFLPNESDPVHFSKDSQAVFLLMRLRNEAHRFANRLREKKVEKAMIG